MSRLAHATFAAPGLEAERRNLDATVRHEAAQRAATKKENTMSTLQEATNAAIALSNMGKLAHIVVGDAPAKPAQKKGPTVTLALRNGVKREVPCVWLIVHAGTTTHKLALHKTDLGDWAVTHPASGAAIVRRITGIYKGCPVSLPDLPLARARELALAEVEQLIARIGADKFNHSLANPKPF